MNRLARITALSAQIDSTLNEFALAANAQGEYPWQTAQRERRNRRLAGAAVGAAAIGAGAYGAKKGLGALNNRYGTSGMDGVKAGAADLVNRADDAVKGGVAKVKAGAQRVQNYGKNVADKFKSLRSGASAGLGLGRRGALMGALKSVKFAASNDLTEFTGSFTPRLMSPMAMRQKQIKAAAKKFKPIGMAVSKVMAGPQAGRLAKFSRADHIIALEAKMDAALAEFEESRGNKAAMATAGAVGTGAALVGADRVLMKRAKKKYGFTPTRATAYGEGVTEAMQSGKRAMKRGMAQAKYHAEPVVRKIKGALGLRKVAGLLK